MIAIPSSSTAMMNVWRNWPSGVSGLIKLATDAEPGTVDTLDAKPVAPVSSPVGAAIPAGPNTEAASRIPAGAADAGLSQCPIRPAGLTGPIEPRDPTGPDAAAGPLPILISGAPLVPTASMTAR